MGAERMVSPGEETAMKLSRVLAVVAAVVLACASTVSGQESSVVEQNERVFRPVEQFTAFPLTARVSLPSELPKTGTPWVKPFLTSDPDALRSAKRQAQQAFQRQSAAPAAPSAQDIVISAVQLTNAPGLAATDNTFGFSPPDATGAIGPEHYVQMVNGLIGVFDRNLVLKGEMNTLDFVGSSSPFVTSDPQISWDQDAQRWFYAVLVFNPDTPNTENFAFGWSTTADPTDLVSGWCHYAFFTGNLETDQPKLGHDESWLWIGVNEFDKSTMPHTFLSGGVFNIPKPARGDTSCGGPVTGFLFFNKDFPMLNEDGTLAFSPVPANVTDPDSTVPGGYSECFIVATRRVRDLPSTKIMVWRGRSRSAGDPVIVPDGDLTVRNYDVPGPVPQFSMPVFMLATGDARFTQAVAHVDPDAISPDVNLPQWAVWTPHTIDGPGGRSVVRWYEIVHRFGEIGLPRNFIRQQGEVQSDTDFVFNGAISPSSRGNDALIIYNRASSALSPIVAAQSRQSGTALHTMDPGELTLAASVDVDLDVFCVNSDNTCRWGDYAGAAPDPVFPGVVWGTNQFNGPEDPNGLPSWQTQISAVSTEPAVISPLTPGKR